MGDKKTARLLKLADELLWAAQNVYDHDDVFTSDTSRQDAELRRERDQALGEAILAYRSKRG